MWVGGRGHETHAHVRVFVWEPPTPLGEHLYAQGQSSAVWTSFLSCSPHPIQEPDSPMA